MPWIYSIVDSTMMTYSRGPARHRLTFKLYTRTFSVASISRSSKTSRANSKHSLPQQKTKIYINYIIFSLRTLTTKTLHFTIKRTSMYELAGRYDCPPTSNATYHSCIFHFINQRITLLFLRSIHSKSILSLRNRALLKTIAAARLNLLESWDDGLLTIDWNE